MFVDSRNGPDWDLAEPAPTPRAYIIASTPRTGSTLLCRDLWASGCAGAPKEYLNPSQIRDWSMRLATSRWHRLAWAALRGPALPLALHTLSDSERVVERLQTIRRLRTGPSGLFGLKIHWHHFRRHASHSNNPIVEALQPSKWIRVVRRDRVRQAVSWARALQTGRWSSNTPGWLPPLFLPRLIHACEKTIRAHERAWDAWFLRAGIVPEIVEYESLTTDRVGTTLRLLATLGQPQRTVSLGSPNDHLRQADATTELWLTAYRRWCESHPRTRSITDDQNGQQV